MTELGEIIASFYKGIQLSEPEEERTTLTLWIPLEHKKKYIQLQKLSNKRFGKQMIELIKKSIDSVSTDHSI